MFSLEANFVAVVCEAPAEFKGTWDLGKCNVRCRTWTCGLPLLGRMALAE